MKNKLSYALLLISLNIGYLTTIVLRVFAFIIKKQNPKNDLILFPYAQKGSDGYTRRFEEYFQFLDKDGVSYKVCDIADEEVCIDYLETTASRRYFMYHKIFWTRLWQVVAARNYKAAFIHRGLFVFYPDIKTPYLELLLRKLCNNITIDFWDSVWHFNPELVERTVKTAHKLSVVNSYIKDYFWTEYGAENSILFPIGVNLEKYIVKTDYSLNNPIRLFYTGLPGNVKKFLALFEGALKELSSKYQLTLVLVTKGRFEVESLNIEYHNFDESTFFNILHGCDIGLYAIEDNDYTRGKMAMKVLDYMSAGLPIIASSAGLTPYAADRKNLLLAEDETSRIKLLEELISNENLRKELGQNARETAEKYHSIGNSYELFKEMVFNK